MTGLPRSVLRLRLRWSALASSGLRHVGWLFPLAQPPFLCLATGLPMRTLRMRLAATAGYPSQSPSAGDDRPGSSDGPVRYPDVYEGRSYADPVRNMTGDVAAVRSSDGAAPGAGAEGDARAESEVFGETYQARPMPLHTWLQRIAVRRGRWHLAFSILALVSTWCYWQAILPQGIVRSCEAAGGRRTLLRKLSACHNSLFTW